MSKRDEAQCSSKSSSNTDAPPKEPDVVPPVLKKSKKKVFIEDVRDKTLKCGEESVRRTVYVAWGFLIQLTCFPDPIL